MKVDQLNSPTDGHKEDFDKMSYANYAHYMSGYSLDSSIGGTYSPAASGSAGIKGLRTTGPIDKGFSHESSTMGMTAKYFKEKCNACSGLPCK